jgi:hypothetical protein
MELSKYNDVSGVRLVLTWSDNKELLGPMVYLGWHKNQSNLEGPLSTLGLQIRMEYIG